MLHVAETGRCMTLLAAAMALARRAGVTSPDGLFPLPETGWRATALRRLMDPLRPIAAPDQRALHTSCALTDGGWQRLRLLAGSAHWMKSGRKLRWWSAAPGRLAVRLWDLETHRSLRGTSDGNLSDYSAK